MSSSSLRHACTVRLRRMRPIGPVLLFALLSLAPAWAEAPEQIPARPADAVMVPQPFLRAWDPVTIFFDRATGPAELGIETRPERHVRLTPAHPGVYQWLNRRTLQFRPVDPWPPLSRYRWQIGNRTVEVSTLMAAAIASLPADGATNLAPLDTLELSFATPVDLEALQRMLSIDVYRQPGMDDRPLRSLRHGDFSVQQLERAAHDAPARYRLRLNEAIAEGMRVKLRLRLAVDDDAAQSLQVIDFSTRGPFRALAFGCAGQLRALSAAGSDYPAEDALLCRPGNPTLEVQFSHEPALLDAVLGRNLIRFEPAVESLEYRVAGDRIRISGEFQPDTLYRMLLVPSDLQDVHQRSLQMSAVSSLHFAFPAPDDFLTINADQGRVMMESQGPRMLPLRGRGDARLDLRIHRIAADDLDFWPYVSAPVSVNDDARPPGPGEQPEPRSQLRMSPQQLAARIHALGSPSVSEIVELPLAGSRQAARFGLDLAPFLDRVSGPSRPGTYLVGLRRLGTQSQRQWVRLQVTDLSLTVVEEERQLRLYVTSLRTGLPLPNARIRIDAAPVDANPTRLLYSRAEGVTDRSGAFVWRPEPGQRDRAPERIMVTLGEDRLVVDVRDDPPLRFFRNNFSPAGDWLGWTASAPQLRNREAAPSWHCHLYTERPVYRPEEPIHIAGYLRSIHRGRISVVDNRVGLVIRGPDGSEWRHSPELLEDGSFYHLFDDATAASGDYTITLNHGDENRATDCKSVTVEKIAYRIPRFKVSLSGPRRTGMDSPFEVTLDAEYYAGGMVQDRPVRWRVTQFPYAWTPRNREGYLFSSDARYGGESSFASRPALSSEGRTDDRGGASLSIDPTQEPTAQPRRYVFEATVTGDDDQTVTDTLDVLALPPFVLGLSAPRYLENADSFQASVIMVGPDDTLIAGRDIELRLLRRRWAAQLQASDFSDGNPRYSTEVIDEVLSEQLLTSGEAPVALTLSLNDTGVYLLEVSAQDALGRRQSVELDLFNSAQTRATWPKPPAQTFTVSSERDSYAPGETARLILQSPLAQAQVLAVVELPDGNHGYHWLQVDQGQASFELPIRREYMPGVPVHFLLMRGRLPQVPGQNGSAIDMAKPVMMASSAQIDVSTAAHSVQVELEYPETARPGDELPMQISLSDEQGRPLSGQVTLWLVDQAVLALGTEQRLDPLPDFVHQREARAQMRDTRNRPVGYLPFLSEPGGDGGRAGASAFEILDGLSIRDTFETVPYFEHGIRVGRNGQATVSIKLPDDLTNFMVRAKATSGEDRFGHQSGRISVRLPLIVQPALPRFLRYGDSFELAATSRMIDAQAAEGVAALSVSGLELLEAAEQTISWPEGGALRIAWQARVAMPEISSDDPAQPPRAEITVGVQRDSDGVGDGFATRLPVLPDRHRVRLSQHHRLASGQSLTLKGVQDAVRDNSLQRSLLVSDQAAVLEVVAALNTLLQQSHGGAELRISRARALLAARELVSVLYPGSASELIDRQITATLAYIDEATLADGTVGFWPGASQGHLATTAWALKFMVEVQKAGIDIDAGLKQRLHDALQRALRGDYALYHSPYLERTMALTALAADGNLDSGYAAELARRTQFLQTETTARVARALALEPDRSEAMLTRLADTLWSGLVFRLQEGEEVYAGLRESRSDLSPQVLPSEARSIAQVLRAMHAIGATPQREQQLVDILLQLGRGNGWGSSNADAEAIMALMEVLTRVDSARTPWSISVRGEVEEQRHGLNPEGPLQALALSDQGDLEVSSDQDQGEVGLLHQLSYLPLAPGSQAEAQSNGLVAQRSLVRISADGEQRFELNAAGSTVTLMVGDIIEDRLTVVNPELRHHVAIVLPLAAGMEPLNPGLQTAPPEARVSRAMTRPADYARYDDDQVVFYYHSLPAGTFEFALRSRAQVPGRYTQPPAQIELMYQRGVFGFSHGAAVVIERQP